MIFENAAYLSNSASVSDSAILHSSGIDTFVLVHFLNDHVRP